MTITVAVLAAVLAAVNGGNDVAKGVATLAGSGVSRYRTAIAYGTGTGTGTGTTLVGALAAIWLGGAMQTLFTGGILDTAPTDRYALAVLVGTAGWVGLATLARLPVSTTHALVGALVGAGVVTAPRAVVWPALATRVALPLLASAAIAYLLSALLAAVVRRRTSDPESARLAAVVLPLPRLSTLPARARSGLHWLSAGAVGAARGLNDTPKIAAVAGFALLPAGAPAPVVSSVPGQPRRSVVAAILAGLAVLIAGCSGPDPGDGAADSGSGAGSAPEPVALPQAGADPPEGVPSALDDMRHASFPEPLVDPDEIISGGPPPDGIPAIDEPTFLKVADVDFLADDEAILELTLGGETRGYPVQIMTYHEIVNDTVGEVPVAVTYCPLCNSGLAFERQIGDRLLSFGTSGRLWSNNLVMYDRQTESLWPQLSFTASVGMLTGTKLVPHLTSMLAWRDFREAYPDAWVLSRDTGHDRPYGRNPYLAYDQPDGQPLFGAPDDDRLPPQTRVLGIEDEAGNATPVAIVRDGLASAGVIELTVGDTDLVAWHRAGQASALEADDVAGGRDIGTVGVFVPEIDGRRLTFTADETGFRDTETGSTWNVLGAATAGPLAGEQPTNYRHVDTFWHSWVAFQPDTTIFR